jgi:hypothetical protein
MARPSMDHAHSSKRWQPASVELAEALGPAWQDAKANGAVGLAAPYLGQRRSHLVVTDNQVIPGMRIERKPRVAKVPGHYAGLVLLVIVYPELDHRLLSRPIKHISIVPRPRVDCRPRATVDPLLRHPDRRALTPAEVAELLGLSRPFVVRLLYR